MPTAPTAEEENLANVPLLGWLTGARGRQDEYQRNLDEERDFGVWDDLQAGAPSVEDLSVEHGQLGYGDEMGQFYGGSPEMAGATGDIRDQRAQHGALSQLQEWARGGLTDADRGMAEATSQARSQRSAQGNAALDRQMRARGMGGSGAEYQQRLAGQQGLTQADSMADAQMQQAAMQRALGAAQGAGGLASQMRGQSYGEDRDRRSSIDDFNRYNMQGRRDRERYNVGAGDRTQQSGADAQQQAYGNRERGAAGQTGQYSQAEANRRADQRRRDEGEGDALAGVTGFLGAL